MKLLFSLALAVSTLIPHAQAEPFFKANDVVALVGGEEMVAAAEQGELELRLVRAFPELHLKFRSLAWEGDTVFEQPRDLNYPSLEQQLDDTGATVVLAGFGLMESLAGLDGAPKFAEAYGKLIDRLAGGGKRRVVLIAPLTPRAVGYSSAIKALAKDRQLEFVEAGHDRKPWSYFRRDGLHASEEGQRAIANAVLETLGHRTAPSGPLSTEEFHLADTIRAKNKLWFHYARPQNWAFLNGDRTIQPSSRDHLDPSKRWFPEEMKQWLPLIAQKETEIWKLAGAAH